MGVARPCLSAPECIEKIGLSVKFLHPTQDRWLCLVVISQATSKIKITLEIWALRVK